MDTMRWNGAALKLLDQTQLPSALVYIDCRSAEDVARAICEMQVRGAPAIGAAAAFGLALAAVGFQGDVKEKFFEVMENARAMLAKTRPTAVNLFWALNRMKNNWEKNSELSIAEITAGLVEEAQDIVREDLKMNRILGDYGAELVPEDARIITHCNAGALATAGYGTALGVIRSAYRHHKVRGVWVDETRPLLQGARLTAWELRQDGIPATLITDNMAAAVMQRGMADMVIVGADRITALGDVANKIGTYGLAVLANYHHLPFYVAAPWSTLDVSLNEGKEIPIEERSAEEVTHIAGKRLAPEGIAVFNPAFDVTPHQLVTAIITERGILRPPYRESILQSQKRQSKGESST